MSKVLIVFYSYTGTARRAAQLLAASQGWETGEVFDARKREGTWGTWRCIFDSLLRRSPPIAYTGPNPRAYDAVVLVAPIWVYRLAGPMRAFVKSRSDVLRHVAMVTVMGGTGAPNAVAEVTRLIGHPPMLDVAFKAAEVDSGELTARLQAFGKAVEDAERHKGEVVRPPVWSPSAG